MYLIIVLGYLIIALPEILTLYKNNKKKETLFYSITILFSFIISILLTADVKLPRPMIIIEKIVSVIIQK